MVPAHDEANPQVKRQDLQHAGQFRLRHSLVTWWLLCLKESMRQLQEEAISLDRKVQETHGVQCDRLSKCLNH